MASYVKTVQIEWSGEMMDKNVASVLATAVASSICNPDAIAMHREHDEMKRQMEDQRRENDTLRLELQQMRQLPGPNGG